MIDMNKLVTAAFDEEKLFQAIASIIDELLDYEQIAEMYIEAHEDEIHRLAQEYAEYLID